MHDFGIAHERISHSAQRIVDRALEDARRRHHDVLTNGHLLIAFAHPEPNAPGRARPLLEPNHSNVLRALQEHLGTLPTLRGQDVRVSDRTKLVFKLASDYATQAGRQTIEASDLVSAIFDENDGIARWVVRRCGSDPDAMAAQLAALMRDHELREERLQKRLELSPALKEFARNLNLLARQDKIAPAYGRQTELQQVLEILCHRERSNSVMLVGEPGVGKTAIVEGLAWRIEFQPESVPARLRDCQVLSLQINALVAGTMLRGMFEERIQNILREVMDRSNLILFVDEAHTLVGAGSALGAPSDAANAFKSVLARGEVRMIGATTLTEYKEHIQEDEALARRFRTVHVSEPTIEEARRILYNVRPRLECNYSVRLLDDAIETALAMSPRYQRHLHLPDKVIGWLDTAAVRAEIDGRLDVRASDVAEVISHASQIPKDMVFRDVGDRFKGIAAALGKRIIGQKKAVQALAHRLVLNKGPLKDGFDRPDGVLLFLGPTGVGKTELAKAVAEFLFGDPKKMIRIDMSEYQDGALSVNKLIGSPRGVVGSERGGILTNQLRDNPCSVVLLDEIEKASPSLLNLFLQAFDEGWLTDGRGKRVYLSDAIVIMTSNVGSELFAKLQSPMGFRSGQAPIDQIQSEINRELERRFSPEFLNRIDQVVVFEPLTRDEVRAIGVKYIDEVNATLKRYGKAVTIAPEALDQLVTDGYSPTYGARLLKRVIDEKIKLPLSQQWKDATRFHVTLQDGQISIATVDVRVVTDAEVERIAS